MRLDRVRLEDSHKVKDLLSFYMGKTRGKDRNTS